MADEQEKEAAEMPTHWDGVGPYPPGWPPPESYRIPIPPEEPEPEPTKAKLKPKKPTK